MACCFPSRDKHVDTSNYILDIEQILQDFVWNKFKVTRSPWQRLCLRRQNYDVHVPMNYFHFEKLHEEVTPRVPHSTPLPQTQSSVVSGMTHQPEQVRNNPLFTNTNVMALSTDFTNNTTQEQTYTFRFEKTRKAALNVTFQKGFSFGGKVNFNIGMPKLTGGASGGGGIDMRLNISKSNGELIEESLTWEAKSDIKVHQSTNYRAKVLLSETPVSYNFTVLTKMYMPSGGAPVTITRKNSSHHHTHVVDNLKIAFEGYDHAIQFDKVHFDEKTAAYAVVFKTRGIIEGIRLCDQKIVLEGTKIEPRTAAIPPPLHDSSFSRPNLQHVTWPENVSSDGNYADGHTQQRGALRSSSGHHPHYSQSHLPPHLHQPPPSSSIPIIEEAPEDDVVDVVGVETVMSQSDHRHQQSQQQQQQQLSSSAAGYGGADREGPTSSPSQSPSPSAASSSSSCPQGPAPRNDIPLPASGGLAAGVSSQMPRITHTGPSSQASSPLSEAGSPDIMSESGSKKSQTVTTV